MHACKKNAMTTGHTCINVGPWCEHTSGRPRRVCVVFSLPLLHRPPMLATQGKATCVWCVRDHKPSHAHQHARWCGGNNGCGDAGGGHRALRTTPATAPAPSPPEPEPEPEPELEPELALPPSTSATPAPAAEVLVPGVGDSMPAAAVLGWRAADVSAVPAAAVVATRPGAAVAESAREAVVEPCSTGGKALLDGSDRAPGAVVAGRVAGVHGGGSAVASVGVRVGTVVRCCALDDVGAAVPLELWLPLGGVVVVFVVSATAAVGVGVSTRAAVVGVAGAGGAGAGMVVVAAPSSQDVLRCCDASCTVPAGHGLHCRAPWRVAALIDWPAPQYGCGMQAVPRCLVDVWYVLAGHEVQARFALVVAALMRCPLVHQGWAVQAVPRCFADVWYVLAGHEAQVCFFLVVAVLMRCPLVHQGCAVHDLMLPPAE